MLNFRSRDESENSFRFESRMMQFRFSIENICNSIYFLSKKCAEEKFDVDETCLQTSGLKYEISWKVEHMENREKRLG